MKNKQVAITASGMASMELPQKLISNLTVNATNYQPSFTGIPESLRGYTIANVITYTAFNSAATISGAAPNFFAALLTMGKLWINRIEYSDSSSTKNINMLIYGGGYNGDESDNLALVQDTSVSSSNIVAAINGSWCLDASTGFRIAVPNVTSAQLALYIDRFEPYNN